MDIKKMSVGELKKLQLTIEKEIKGRQKHMHIKVLEEIKAVAAKHGFRLADLVGSSTSKSKPRNLISNVAKNSPGKPAGKKLKVILYRHPEIPELTWGGGRGRRPQWIKDWEASGRLLEETRV